MVKGTCRYSQNPCQTVHNSLYAAPGKSDASDLSRQWHIFPGHPPQHIIKNDKNLNLKYSERPKKDHHRPATLASEAQDGDTCWPEVKALVLKAHVKARYKSTVIRMLPREDGHDDGKPRPALSLVEDPAWGCDLQQEDVESRSVGTVDAASPITTARDNRGGGRSTKHDFRCVSFNAESLSVLPWLA